MITLVNGNGPCDMTVAEAEHWLPSVEATHVYDYHRVLDTISPFIRLRNAICLSYVGVNRDNEVFLADLLDRIRKGQIKLAILVYKRSFKPIAGTKAWVIARLKAPVSFYDDALDHLFSAHRSRAASLGTFLVRSGGLSKEEMTKTGPEFCKHLTHVPSLIQHLRGGERGATKKTRIHRLLYSNAALLARGFRVTLSGPCGNQLQDPSGATINVLDSDEGMNSIVYEISDCILFQEFYKNGSEFQETVKHLLAMHFFFHKENK